MRLKTAHPPTSADLFDMLEEAAQVVRLKCQGAGEAGGNDVPLDRVDWLIMCESVETILGCLIRRLAEVALQRKGLPPGVENGSVRT